MPAYKDKKRGTWYAAFYYKDWTGATKHTIKRGFKTQREAKDYERMFLDKLSHRGDILFESLVENYLEDMSSRLKPTTMAGKRPMYEKHIVPYFGKLQIRDIDTITVRQWQNLLLQYRDENGKPYAQTYIRSINAQLSAVLNYAVKHYGLIQNPCHIAGTIGKSKAYKMNFWTKEQYERFSSCIPKPATKLAFDILFYTGIREGELLALTDEDVTEDHKLRINKNYATVNGEEMLLTPKSPKSLRTIAIPDFLYKQIKDYIGSIAYREDERIFYFSKSSLLKDIHKYADVAGLPHITVHDLRHSHASLLINMNVNIMEISERLGHESVKTTWDIYSHLYPDTDKELASMLDELKRPE